MRWCIITYNIYYMHRMCVQLYVWHFVIIFVELMEDPVVEISVTMPWTLLVFYSYLQH